MSSDCCQRSVASNDLPRRTDRAHGSYEGSRARDRYNHQPNQHYSHRVQRPPTQDASGVQSGRSKQSSSNTEHPAKRHDSKNASDHWDVREDQEKGEAAHPVISARRGRPREQRGQDGGRGISRYSNSEHDNHQDRVSPCDTEGKKDRDPVVPGTLSYDDVIKSRAVFIVAERRSDDMQNN